MVIRIALTAVMKKTAQVHITSHHVLMENLNVQSLSNVFQKVCSVTELTIVLIAPTNTVVVSILKNIYLSIL